MNILIVDDHPSVMEGTRAMLEKAGSYQVALCASADEVLELVLREPFDVMLFDLYMPGMNGIDLTKKVCELVPDAVVLIYTGSDVAPLFNKLMDAGVSGFISKTATSEQLATAIACAARKEAVVPVSLLRELRKDVYHLPDGEEEDSRIALSEKDQQLLRELAKGKNNRELAEQFLMSQRSLEYALTRLFQKLKVRSRIEAVQKAKDMGLVLSEDFL